MILGEFGAKRHKAVVQDDNKTKYERGVEEKEIKE